MVKFGRRLLSERNEAWAAHYIDYKVRRGRRTRLHPRSERASCVMHTPGRHGTLEMSPKDTLGF